MTVSQYVISKLLYLCQQPEDKKASGSSKIKIKSSENKLIRWMDGIILKAVLGMHIMVDSKVKRMWIMS